MIRQRIKNVFSEKSSRKMVTPNFKYNVFTLSFEDNFEKKFQADYFLTSLWMLRLAIMVGLLFYSIFMIADIYMYPGLLSEFFTIRFLIVCPVILTVFFLSYTKRFYKYWQLAASIAAIVTGVGIIAMTVITSRMGESNYYAGIILVLFYTYMVIKLRFIWASLTGLIIVVLYFLSAIFFKGVEDKFEFLNLFFLVSANVLGMFGGYAFELYARKDFYYRYLLREEGRKVELANKGLAEKVKEKTKDLEEDIQRRKKVEEELIIAKEKAEESNKLKSAFLKNISHEVRTPMNGLFGFINLLASHDLSKEEIDDYSEVIKQSGERMINTVYDIVTISKIETEQVEIFYTEVNIRQKINELNKSFQTQIKDKEIHLKIEHNNNLEDYMLKTDEAKLTSVLLNLIKNAIKYTENGIIEISYKIENNNFEFKIKDTGIGIPENKKEVIFNPFVQADTSDGNTRSYEGSGLGLAICKSYIEMLGGKIYVDSEEGKGSEFYFSIPLVEDTNSFTNTNSSDM